MGLHMRRIAHPDESNDSRLNWVHSVERGLILMDTALEDSDMYLEAINRAEWSLGQPYHDIDSSREEYLVSSEMAIRGPLVSHVEWKNLQATRREI